MIQIEDYFGNGEISEIKYPFNAQNIIGITMVMTKQFFTPNFYFYATVEFQNGMTTGKQKIEGENLSDLYKKVYEFCKSL